MVIVYSSRCPRNLQKENSTLNLPFKEVRDENGLTECAWPPTPLLCGLRRVSTNHRTRREQGHPPGHRTYYYQPLICHRWERRELDETIVGTYSTAAPVRLPTIISDSCSSPWHVSVYICIYLLYVFKYIQTAVQFNGLPCRYIRI